MINVLFVEDERLMVQGFLHSIQWNKYGYSICATAHSAEDAIIVCESIKPDIAILDINLPKMNGLELAKFLKSKFPKIKIIILTAYNDFEFAREAVRLKIDEYLLKPEIEFEDILATMERLKDRTLLNNTDNRYNMVLSSQVHALLCQKKQNDECLSDITDIFCNIPGDLYFAIAISIEPAQTNLSAGEVVANLHNSFYRNGIYSSINESLYCGIIKVADNMPKIIDSAKNFIEKSNSQFIFGFGRGTKSIPSLAEDFSDALCALKKRYYNSDTLYYYDNSYISYDISEYSILKDKICKSMEYNNYKQFKNDIEALLAKIMQDKLPQECVVNMVLEIFYAIIKKVERLNGNINVILNENNFNAYHRINSFSKFSDLENWIYTSIDRIISFFISATSVENNVITKAVQYINENFADNTLTLETLANELHINYSYLSTLFTNSLKESFNKYLTKIRMEKAQQIILSSNYKASYISEMVGYNNFSYFIKMFKNYTGYTPSEYRKKFLGDNLK